MTNYDIYMVLVLTDSIHFVEYNTILYKPISYKEMYVIEHILCIVRQNWYFEMNPYHVQSSIPQRPFKI